MVAVRRFVLLVLAFFAPEVARCVIRSWVPIGPSGNPDVTAVAVVPFGPGVYVATDGSGVLKTDDGGKTWTAVNTGLSTLSVRALSVFGFSCAPPCAAPSFRILFAGTNGGGVFRGDGTSWTPVNNGLGNLSVTALAIVQTGSSFQFTLYAATDGGGIFRSDDGGGHWVSASESQPELARSVSIAADPESPLTAYASSGREFFKTADGGATWSRIFQNVNVGAVAIDPLQGSMLYIAGSVQQCPPPCAVPPAPPAVLKSSDAGATWQTLAAPVIPFAFAFQVASGSSVVYVAGYGGVVSTADGGATWTGDQTGLPPLRAVENLAVTLSGTVFAAVPGFGVFASGCVSGSGALCLNQARFQVSVSWKSTDRTEQPGTAAPITSSTGAFWFFDPTNLELVVKVLDGRSVNGKFWVFYGALSNVEYTITVTDTLTGAVKTYFNPQGQLASVADTSAF